MDTVRNPKFLKAVVIAALATVYLMATIGWIQDAIRLHGAGSPRAGPITAVGSIASAVVPVALIGAALWKRSGHEVDIQLVVLYVLGLADLLLIFVTLVRSFQGLL